MSNTRQGTSSEWCPFNENDRDDKTGELCKPYTNPDRHGVRDMIDGECIEDVNDVIQASDGLCYRKSSLKEWYETSQRRGYIPNLPKYRKPFTIEDIRKLGIDSYADSSIYKEEQLRDACTYGNLAVVERLLQDPRVRRTRNVPF